LDDLRTFLDSLQMFGIKPGLEQTRKLMDAAGNPERKLKFIHIAGTNGKGSTGAMLEQGLRSAGFRTGFYSSPHLVDVAERFKIDGKDVDNAVLAAAGDKLRTCAQGLAFTYFEFTTVLAAMLFADAKVDFVIWETGMGGRLDATNVVTPLASVITNIALDHQRYLGDTIAAIAAEKAGIIKPGVPVFCGALPHEAANVAAQVAAAQNAPIFTATAEAISPFRYERGRDSFFQVFEYCGQTVELPLLGTMQRNHNFKIVYLVLKYLAQKFDFKLETALAGLRGTFWPARCQELERGFIVDGGHNPDGVAALTAAMREVYPGEKFTVIFAGFKDKEVKTSLEMLQTVAKRFIFVPLHEYGRPSYSGEELGRMLDGALPYLAADNVRHALLLADDKPILAAGSLYLAGEILAVKHHGTAAKV